ncbi:fibroblast growth factor 1 isoform X3 [Equus quagga]|uniref:Fibroblast growth factor n=1 Tax=Equus przewalskii TaxID=9798 RepID=A0ABM4KEK9_EQUPR|nr:fibroblast growth factor 1 isoform X3 [Equus quagga]
MGTPSCSSLPAAVWVGQRGCCRLMQLPSPQKDSAPQPKQRVQLQLSAESVGEVYIKSTETGQYLAMDTDGLLYGSQTPNEECLFLERLEENHYNTYTSKKHAEKNWFVGLKKNGSCKRGPRTHYGQKAILFLPLPVSSD